MEHYNGHAEMKKVTAAMYRFTGGTSGCGCAARLPIESGRGLPGYSLLQVTFTRSHHSSLDRLSHVFVSHHGRGAFGC
jgi:hypothetical protein